MGWAGDSEKGLIIMLHLGGRQPMNEEGLGLGEDSQQALELNSM